MSPGEPRRITVMVVDDSAVVRSLMRRIVEQQPDLQVVASVPNGRAAVETMRTVRADVVLLDVEMPDMDGLEALPLLLKEHPKTRVIMSSTLTTRGAKVTLEALTKGAADYVPKPTTLSMGLGLETIATEVIAKIRALGAREACAAGVGAGARRTVEAVRRTRPIRVLAVGSSTGGPNALSTFFGALPKSFQLPVLLVQHMPPLFTAMLADRLAKDSGRPSVEAVAGMPVQAGRIHVAPGDYHMVVDGAGGSPVLQLNQQIPENFCRPAVDPLFRSVAAVYGADTVAVVLTGMGEDGRRGAEQIGQAGGTVLAQDEESSVVWGMPGAIARAGLATALLPPDQLALQVARLAERR